MKRRNRYKYKLNMLEPGLVMMKIIGILLAAGFLLWAVKQYLLFKIAFLSAGAIFAVLLILVAIEAHQDKVLNNIALQENIESAENYKRRG